MQSKDFKYHGHRNSHTELNKIYFWTTTINKWQHLLKPDVNKMIAINSLQWLVQKGLVKIYGYVIMHNHIHLIWEQLKMNGKGLPKNSFEKFTAKTLLNNMQKNKEVSLKNYCVDATDRAYNIWQRDPSAVQLFNIEMAAQKLDDIHLNPHCSLSGFYATSQQIIGFLPRSFMNSKSMILVCLLIWVRHYSLWLVRHQPRRRK